MEHPAFRDSSPASNERVSEYFDALGRSDSPLLDTTLDAIAQGQALFPSGAQRYRAVRTEHSLILATEGLAEHGIELYLEIMHGQGWMYEQIQLNWQYRTLQEAARAVNQLGGLPLDGLPAVLVVPAVHSAPMQLYFEEGGAAGQALLLGMDVPGRPATTADGSVRMVALTPITPTEYALIQETDSVDAVVANRVELNFHHVIIDAPEVTGMIDEKLGSQ